MRFVGLGILSDSELKWTRLAFKLPYAPGSNGSFHFLSRWKTVCRSEDDDCLLFDEPEMEVDSGEWKLKFRGGGNVEIEQ